MTRPEPEVSDETLMDRLAEGDEAAFEVLFERYQGPLLTFLCRYTNDRHKAEDLFQKAFLRVYEHRVSFRGHAKFRTWLYTIAVNASRDQHRHDQLRRVHSLDAAADRRAKGEVAAYLEPEGRDAEPADVVLGRELSEQLESAIGALETEYRAPFVLARFSELSYAEIAETLDLTVPTVRMRVHRAHKKLARTLAPYVGAGKAARS